jgi:putative N-acetylmannosamine-6-phosphate epimerase
MQGIIASIQKYTLPTTQELVNSITENGVAGIRTDQPIKCNLPVIGLSKIPGKEYYITTEKKLIYEVAKWADYVAIDSRRGNREIDFLYAHCHTADIKIVADIEKIEDVQNILEICENLKIKKPGYIATTFSNCNIELVSKIKEITEIPVIAEGGYKDREQIIKAKLNGASAVCIGSAIEMDCLVNHYNQIWSNVC